MLATCHACTKYFRPATYRYLYHPESLTFESILVLKLVLYPHIGGPTKICPRIVITAGSHDIIMIICRQYSEKNAWLMPLALVFPTLARRRFRCLLLGIALLRSIGIARGVGFGILVIVIVPVVLVWVAFVVLALLFFLFLLFVFLVFLIFLLFLLFFMFFVSLVLFGRGLRFPLWPRLRVLNFFLCLSSGAVTRRRI